MKIIKEKTYYTLSDGQYNIRVEVSGNGEHFTIRPSYGGDDGFVFIGSKKETILAIAKLLVEAIELE